MLESLSEFDCSNCNRILDHIRNRPILIGYLPTTLNTYIRKSRDSHWYTVYIKVQVEIFKIRAEYQPIRCRHSRIVISYYTTRQDKFNCFPNYCKVDSVKVFYIHYITNAIKFNKISFTQTNDRIKQSYLSCARNCRFKM